MRTPHRRPLHTLSAVALVLAVIGGGCAPEADEPQSQQQERSPSASTSTESGGADPGSTEPEAVSAVALPAVAQPGKQPGPIPSDSGLVVATVRPAAPGATVRLERQQGDAWRTVARAPQDHTGHANFADLPPAGESVRYRAVASSSDGTSPSATVEASGWRSIFADEFDGTALDGSKWGYRQLGIYNADGGRLCSKSDPSAVAVAGGTLQLQVRADPERAGQRCTTPEDGTHDYYLNGHVATEGKFDFTHGVAAARVRFQRGRGQHGAFWMQRQVPEQIPGDPETSGAEIDIAEFFGDGYPKGGMAAFAYYLNEDNENEKIGGVIPEATRQLPKGDAWWSSYHVFSVEWTPERYVFRVDGREVFRTDEGVSGVDQFMVLSLQSSDWELAKLDRSTLPSEMNVDWVRVWQPAATGG